jgi:hypothetical protein
VTIYLGPVGNLIALPSIGRGITANMSLPSAVHEIAGTRGGRVVDRVGAAKRTYAMSRDHLSLDELSALEALYLGAYGPGPFVLLEPWRRNLLTANQAAGTDVLADTTGFAANAGTITSGTSQADAGLRSVAWAVTAANQQVLTGSSTSLTASDDTVDIPVLPATVYSARVRARLSASTGTVRLDMRWHDRAEAFISASTGTATALSTSAFTDCPCTNITSPAGAALLRLAPINTASGAAQTIYLDQWQVQQAAALDAWTVGTGVPRVMFTGDIGETYSIYPSVSAQFELTEV